MKKLFLIVLSLYCNNYFLSAQPITQLERQKSISQQIQPGQLYKYSINLKEGEYAKVIVTQIGIDLMVTTFSPAGIKLNEFDSPNGANGAEPTEIIAGISGLYTIEVKPFDEKQKDGKFTVNIDKQLPFKDYTEPVINWFTKNSVAMKSTNPGTGFTDLLPLKKILANVSIVGLGEATHGSHEIFTMKHRLIEFLVTQMSYTAVCIEDSYAETKKLNEYIIGKINVKPLLLNLGRWIDDTEEMNNLIEWMRNYNKGKQNKIQLLGIDPQVNSQSIMYLEKYFTKNIPDFNALIKPLFDSLQAQDDSAINFLPTLVKSTDLSQLERMLTSLVLNKSTLIAKTFNAEYEDAVMYLKMLLYFSEFNAGTKVAGGGSRDKYMAELFEYYKQQLPKNSKLIIWAHNTHVSTKNYGFKPMGTYIKELNGANYYAIASSFNEGSFNAQIPYSYTNPPQVMLFTLPASPQGSIDWILKETRKGNAFFNLRSPGNIAVTDWLSIPQRMHWVGGWFSDKYSAANYMQPFTLKTDFDGVMFFEKVTAATRIKR